GIRDRNVTGVQTCALPIWFTEDATYTTFAGTYYSGREDIVGSHAVLFDDVLADTRLADRFLELRMLTADVAVLTTRGDNYQGEEIGRASCRERVERSRQDA